MRICSSSYIGTTFDCSCESVHLEILPTFIMNDSLNSHPALFKLCLIYVPVLWRRICLISSSIGSTVLMTYLTYYLRFGDFPISVYSLFLIYFDFSVLTVIFMKIVLTVKALECSLSQGKYLFNLNIKIFLFSPICI